MVLNLLFQSQDVLGISFLVCFPKLFHLTIFSGLFHVFFYIPLKGWLCQGRVGRTFSALQTKFPFPGEHSQLAEVRCDHLKPQRLLPHHLFPHFLLSIWWFLPSKCTFWTASPTFNSACIFQRASCLSKVNTSQFQEYIFVPFVAFQWKHWIKPELFC